MSISLNLIVYVVSLAVVAGGLIQQIKYIGNKIDKLEKKQDKHNDLITRVTVLEREYQITDRQVTQNCNTINGMIVNKSEETDS